MPFIMTNRAQCNKVFFSVFAAYYVLFYMVKFEMPRIGTVKIIV